MTGLLEVTGHVRVAMTAGEAVRACPQRRLRRVLGRRRRPDPEPELIWMPSYRIEIEGVGRRGPVDLVCSVDAVSGSFALFDLDEACVAGPAEGTGFDASLSPDEALDVARRELVRVILRSRGRVGEKPRPGTLRSVQLLHHPYWIRYYWRRPERLDLDVVDAASGQRCGSRIKSGVISVFLEDARETCRT